MCTTTKDLRDFDSLFDLLDYFTTEKVCEEYLTAIRWNGKPSCPYCESEKVNTLKGKTKWFKCYGCRKPFGVKVGTIFHDSKISLRKWFIAIYLITAHKKGVSSHQSARDLKITQKSAWFALLRIRKTYNPNHKEIFEGEVDWMKHMLAGSSRINTKVKGLKAPRTVARKRKSLC